MFKCPYLLLPEVYTIKAKVFVMKHPYSINFTIVRQQKTKGKYSLLRVRVFLISFKIAVFFFLRKISS